MTARDWIMFGIGFIAGPIFFFSTIWLAMVILPLLFPCRDVYEANPNSGSLKTRCQSEKPALPP